LSYNCQFQNQLTIRHSAARQSAHITMFIMLKQAGRRRGSRLRSQESRKFLISSAFHTLTQ